MTLKITLVLITILVCAIFSFIIYRKNKKRLDESFEKTKYKKPIDIETSEEFQGCQITSKYSEFVNYTDSIVTLIRCFTILDKENNTQTVNVYDDVWRNYEKNDII